MIINISAHLPKIKSVTGNLYGKSVYEQLMSLLGDRIVEIKNHCNNIWCRDYMPVKNAKGELVQFIYDPSYMQDAKWKRTIPIADEIHRELGLNVISSDLKLDGGAVELYGKKAIVSDRIFRDNDNWDEVDVINELEDKLKVDQLIWVPQYPYDFTGHVDGLVRFIDKNRVLVNDYRESLKQTKKDSNFYRRRLLENWYYAFTNSLRNAGLILEFLPYSANRNINETSGEADYASAVGIYLNFLNLGDRIIMPIFNQPDFDQRAKSKLEQLYKVEVLAVEASELAKEGGIINCITWGGN